MPVFQLPLDEIIFPDPSLAEADGLIGIGGDLSVNRLIDAYLLGFFPWYNEGDDILWWHPLERMVLYPSKLKVAKSMRPYFNQRKFRLTYNTCFKEVMKLCASTKRNDQAGTWITKEIFTSYDELNQLGIAHSVEVWKEDKLVGGLYGLALGKVFYGESMFSLVPNASKFGFISWVKKLEKAGFNLIDCQQETPHLLSLGAELIPQEQFLNYLRNNEQAIEASNTLIYRP